MCAVGSVIGNRVFLIITGYPQLGNGTLHISHAIWGAMMMAIAIIFAISFLAPNNRTFVAFLGGCGFGWFIDELGKFITRDVNYFFEPTIALIYIVFITLYLVFRGIQRRELGPDEAVLNGMEALKSAAIGELSEPRRVAAMALLDDTGAQDPLAHHVRGLLVDEHNLPDSTPNRFERGGSAVRAWYLGLAQHRWFERVITAWFVVIGGLQLVAALAIALDDNAIHGFVDWGTMISERGVRRADRRRRDAAAPSPAVGVPVVRTRDAGRDPRHAGVRVRARAARRRLRPGVEHPHLGGVAVDDPGGDRARHGRFVDSEHE